MTGRTGTKVCFLTLYPESMPSSRLRVYQYLPHLKPLGFEVTVLPALPDPWFTQLYYSRLGPLRALQYGAEALNGVRRILASRQADIVFVQKGILSTSLKGFEKFLENSRVIFDLDDALYGKSVVEFSHPFLRGLQDVHQTEKVSAGARRIVAGNEYLKNQALRCNAKVSLIPTPVDTERFTPVNRSARERKIVLGWIGGAGNWREQVPLIHEPLKKIAGKYPVELKVITRVNEGAVPLQGIPTRFVNWNYAAEVQEMREFDIGLMPLPDNEWTRGKCGLKLLQYMALGIPGVASAVGVNTEIIEEGKDGFLSRDSGEWEDALEDLIQNPPLRKRMGEAARQKVEERYSLKRMVPKMAEVLEEAAR